MVRHGTQKKRRANRKVTRKAPKHVKLRQKNAVRDPEAKKSWDTNISVEDNYRKLGLVGDSNKVTDLTAIRKTAANAFVGFTDIHDLKNIDKNHKKKGNMSEHDQKYALSLIQAYDHDFYGMQMDIKLNTRQLTENQAKKLCEKYLNLDDEDKLV